MISERQPRKVARLVDEMVYGYQLNQISAAAGLQGVNFTEPNLADEYLHG